MPHLLGSEGEQLMNNNCWRDARLEIGLPGRKPRSRGAGMRPSAPQGHRSPFPVPDPLLIALLCRVVQLEAENARLRAELDPHPLAALLWATMRSPFLAADAMAEAERQAEAARVAGQALPELPRLLAEAGITSAHKLGLWLGRNEFEIVSQEGGKRIWCAIAPNIIP